VTRTRLDPFEYFALHSLLNRRPLFRWEENAVTPQVMERLRAMGFVKRVGDGWALTRLGVIALDLKPFHVLAGILHVPKARESNVVFARFVARPRAK
jgi:hypothetical protein